MLNHLWIPGIKASFLWCIIFFKCVCEFNLLIFFWETSHLYSSCTLVYSFLFLWYPYLVSFFLFFFFCLFAISWAAPVAYGGSQARGLIRAVARATATLDPSRVCNLHHSSQQCRIVNPLSKGRDRTHNLMVPSRIH